MLMKIEEFEICKAKTRLLQELINDTKYKNELDLQHKYKKKLNLILHSPIIVNDPIVLYRSRLASDVKDDITLPSTFSYVPLAYNAKNIPKRGRMNLSGQSFFYASSSPDTNYKEIKKDVKAGDEVFLSQWKIAANSGISIFSVVLADNISESVDENACICITDPHIVNGPIGDYLRCFSDIILRKENNADREYLASSLISNKILAEINGKIYKEKNGTKIPFHYDAIAYPSTRLGNGEAKYYNWVITPQFIDDYASLEYVVKGTIKEDLQSIYFKSVGFNHNGVIEWYEPYIYIDDVIYNPIGFINRDGVLFNIKDVTARDKEGKIVSENGLRKFLNNEENEKAYKESIIEELTKKGLFIQKLAYGEIQNETSLIKGNTLELFREVNGWKLENNNKWHDIKFIKIEMTYKNTFKRIENINDIITITS